MNGYDDFENQNRDENRKSSDANGQNENFGYYSSGEKEYSYNRAQKPPKPKTLAWSITSMVAGILSLVCCFFGYAGLIFGIAAVILSVAARKALGYFDGMAIAGLVLGIFGFVFGAAVVWNMLFNSEFIDYMNKYYAEFYKSLDM